MRWMARGVALFVLLGTISLSCAEEGVGGERLEFYVDAASFAGLGRGDSSYVEIYRMIGRDGLLFEEREGGLLARFQVQATLSDLEGEVHAREVRQERSFAGAPDEIRTGQFLFGAYGFVVPPGIYILDTEVVDEGSGAFAAFEDTLVVRRYPADLLALSDLELAVSIVADSSHGEFVKNGLKVVPNPLGAYGAEIPVLYFYAEVYGLSGEGTYTAQYFIIDSAGEVYKSFPAKTRKKPGATSVEVGGINIAAFPPGEYLLHLTVADDADGRPVASEKRFWVWPATLVAFTEEEAERFAGEIDFLVSPRERRMYEELDLRGKAEFARRFWARRDPTRGTLRNEAREEHDRRHAYAKEHFKRGDRNRRRVYIVYGPPDDIERYPQSMGEKPYEVWHYFSVEGGAVFVFADLQGFGQYRLLHSTARGEMSDPDWRRWVRIRQ